jgi:hypothetical protein
MPGVAALLVDTVRRWVLLEVQRAEVRRSIARSLDRARAHACVLACR